MHVNVNKGTALPRLRLDNTAVGWREFKMVLNKTCC